jgi:hypothetical protein
MNQLRREVRSVIKNNGNIDIYNYLSSANLEICINILLLTCVVSIGECNVYQTR